MIDRLVHHAEVVVTNATQKLQLTVLLPPPEAVPGLYLHPDHRRRRRRLAVRSEFSV